MELADLIWNIGTEVPLAYLLVTLSDCRPSAKFRIFSGSGMRYRCADSLFGTVSYWH